MDSNMAGYDSCSSLHSHFSKFSVDSNGKKHVKRLPGETREQAVERVIKDKEKRRLEKLLRLAYPRQREAHLLKHKIQIRPEEQSGGYELMRQKKEQMRQDHERSCQADTEFLEVNEDRSHSRVAFNETPNIAPDRGNALRITENANEANDQHLGSVYHSVSTLENATQRDQYEMMMDTQAVGFRDFDKASSNYNQTQYKQPPRYIDSRSGELEPDIATSTRTHGFNPNETATTFNYKQS